MKSDLTDGERILLMQGKPREQWASIIAERDRVMGKTIEPSPVIASKSQHEPDSFAAAVARIVTEDERVQRERANQRARHAAASPSKPALRSVPAAPASPKKG